MLLCIYFLDIDPVLFSFRVKFYPADPFRLTGNARLMLYQQLKRDLRHGRLYCSLGEAAALGALIVQGIQREYMYIHLLIGLYRVTRPNDRFRSKKLR